ncbi:MAG: hypothetical protein QY318_00175 [Candidatus Dojkabacteria bacterium]|nr:MAG: hypothetical protein QY318_00175 [Candidatus Dojkabacteria bacterium]
MKSILIGVIIMLVVMLSLGFAISRVSLHDNDDSQQDSSEQVETEQIPYYGFAGYTPTNFPDSTAEEARQFYRDIDQYAEIYGVHTDWEETSIVDATIQNSDLDLVVVLGFQDPAQWENDQDEYIAKALQLLEKYPEIKYFGIGNETNLFKYQYPDVGDSFYEYYKEIYTELKTAYPDVIFFTVFQYEAFLGNSYLSGKIDVYEEDWYLLQELDGYMDLAVFTSYPSFDYPTPDQIPDDYYSRISEHSHLPVAFSEIGWPSQSQFEGAFETLNGTGYEGSEEEQLHFLNRFNFLVASSRLHFANWLFLNDPVDWENGATLQMPLANSTGMRTYKGQSKAVFERWVEITE